MPPVRWRLLITVSILTYLETIKSQEFISMTADGWKPIVGNGGPRQAIIQDEITQYRNPSELGNKQNVFKAQTKIPPHTHHPKVSPKPDQSFGIKSKNSISHLHLHGVGATSNMHGIGKNAFKLRLSSGPPNTSHRPPSSNKHSIAGSKKLSKPARSQAGAYSIKNEVYLPAPSSAVGSYVYFNSGRNTQKVRDIPIKQVPNHGLNNPHQYSTTFFTLPGLPSPGPTPAQNFIFPNKHHVQNDINYYANQQHDDEYSKNLVPPPPETQVDDKEQKLFSHQSSIHLPENLVQVPPSFNIQTAYVQKIPGQQGVEVTKQNFNVFRNTVPLNYQETNVNQYQQEVLPDQYPKYTQKTKDPYSNLPTYEVTEGTYWESHLSTARNPPKDPNLAFTHFRRPLLPAEDPTIKTFLPTPLKSEPSPTVASQSDVSAVYTELNLKNRQRERPNNSFFNIKEVSTHYPILGNPVAQNEPENSDLTNEITTKEELPEKTVLTPTKTAYGDWQNSGQEPQVSRPQRRRRPTRPKVSTSPPTTLTHTTPDEVTETYQETSTHKRRRIVKHRLTTTTTELPAANPSNHNFAEGSEQKENSFVSNENVHQKKQEFEKEETQQISEVTSSTRPSEDYSSDDYANSNPETYTDVYDISKEKVQQPKLKKRKRIYPTTSLPKELETTEAPIAETELSYNSETTAEQTQQTEDEISTTLATTSTTTETTTTKTSKIKARPIKAKTRPRFSVKDYRQRLNQHSSSPSSTTTSSTTEASRVRESTNRLRYPHRVRKPTTSNSKEESASSEPSKFTPKEPRFTTTEIDPHTIATEKPVKAVNTRLRPFGRYRSTSTTTEPSTTQKAQKASIKSSIFASGRRPVYPSLKTRIMGKYNRTQTTTSEKPPEEDSGEMEEEEGASDEVETPGMITAKMDTYEAPENEEVKKTTKLNFEEEEEEYDDDEDSTTMKSVSNNDFIDSDPEQDESMIQQRISDLTSSSDNKYNTPGMFKSVSATSRIIPSHFTISTEDPVLPIETFFSSFKEAPK